jgi:hypothetical protein
MTFAENIVAGRSPDIKPPVRHKIASFVRLILSLRSLSQKVRLYRLVILLILLGVRGQGRIRSGSAASFD